MKLSDFKAVTFDCYGTLIDWESGMVEALKPLTGRVTPALTRNQILEAHARQESSQQLWTPARKYSELLAVVYKRLAEEWGVPASWEECQAYGRSVGNWPAFADSPGSLQYLKKYFKLIILSNVDNRTFARSNARRNLGLFIGGCRWFGRITEIDPSGSGSITLTLRFRSKTGIRSGVQISHQSISPAWIAAPAVAKSGMMCHSTRSK